MCRQERAKVGAVCGPAEKQISGRVRREVHEVQGKPWCVMRFKRRKKFKNQRGVPVRNAVETSNKARGRKVDDV